MPRASAALDLDAHVVVRVIEPPAALLRAIRVAGIEPMVADHRQQHIALVDRVAETLAKIHADRNGVGVQEDGPIPEVALQTVVEPPGDIGTVITPVRDEQLGHDGGRPQP